MNVGRQGDMSIEIHLTGKRDESRSGIVTKFKDAPDRLAGLICPVSRPECREAASDGVSHHRGCRCPQLRHPQGLGGVPLESGVSGAVIGGCPIEDFAVAFGV